MSMVDVLKFQILVACQKKAKTNIENPDQKRSDQGLPCLLF